MHFDLTTLRGLSLATLTIAIPAPQAAAPVGSTHNPHTNTTVLPAGDQYIGPIPVSPEYVRHHLSLNSNSSQPYPHPPSSNHTLFRRDGLGMYECPIIGYQATAQSQCQWRGGVEDGKCRKTLFGADMSMGPDPGLKCTVYKNPDCSNHGFYPFVYGGAWDFQTDLWWIAVSCADKPDCTAAPQSYKCQRG